MNWILGLLAPLFKSVGSSLWGWVIAYLTGPQLLNSLESFLENIVAKTEIRAKETADPKDDEDAKMYRSWLEQLKAAKGKRNGNNP